MRFLCDEMLASLARWLRAAGYDADLAAPGAPDRALVERAQNEGRLLLTRDRDILQIKHAEQHVLVLHGDDMDGWAQQLSKHLEVNWLKAPMTRCLVCNVELMPATPEALARMPEDSRALPGPFKSCPQCQRDYWPGSHVKRMMARLESFAAFPGQTPPKTP